MDHQEIERVDRITEAIHRLLHGRIPEPLDVSEHPNDEIRQLSEYVNQLIKQEAHLTESSIKISRGELNEAIENSLPYANSLKNIQASLKHLTWQTQQVAKGDFSQRTKFLGEFSAAFNAMVVKLDEGRTKMQAAMARRKESQSMAEEANRSKSEFLANMSHELRTPLNHIIGFTELVVDQTVGDLNKIQSEYLTDVLTSGHHLLALINDILDLSKVEAGKTELRLTDVCIQEVVSGSTMMFKEKVMNHRIQIIIDMNHIPLTIYADERKLKQIMYNLLSNAVKFTPDGGTIKVRAKLIAGSDDLPPSVRMDVPQKDTRMLMLQVEDDGIGIPPDDLERVFNMFEQVNSSPTKHGPGTGIGLALTRKFVELHGGTIWAESEGTDKGSRFVFVLPLQLPANRPTA